MKPQSQRQDTVSYTTGRRSKKGRRRCPLAGSLTARVFLLSNLRKGTRLVPAHAIRSGTHAPNVSSKCHLHGRYGEDTAVRDDRHCDRALSIGCHACLCGQLLANVNGRKTSSEFAVNGVATPGHAC